MTVAATSTCGHHNRRIGVVLRSSSTKCPLRASVVRDEHERCRAHDPAEFIGRDVPHAWTRMEPSHSKSMPTRSAWGLCA